MISIFLPIKKTSRRIPNKNISRIKNYKYGLTEIKLNQLKKLFFLLKKKEINCDITVSTDSPIVKKYVSSLPWVNLHDRPNHLAKDDCLDSLIKEVPKMCKSKFILWTHVTSPFFDQNDYFSLITKFLAQKKYKSAFSANLISTFILNEKNNWISHDSKKKKWPRTQDLKKFYSVNSAAFLSTRDNYIKLSDRLDSKPMPIITRKGSEFDIDFLEDMNYFKKYLLSS
jgi:CMP-N-acetylneuraminic acid synthetase|tara:strand:+ start:57 stop:737 length:681 start_codon:yes stop_codon:yes gene_type:complete